MREKMLQYVTKIDIFGEPISLRLNKEDTAKTFLGGTMTIALMMTMVVIFFVFFMDVVEKLNPKISVETQVQYPRINKTLTKDNMAVAFGLTDVATGIVDMPNYFTYEVSLFYNENKANGNSYSIPLEHKKCESEDFPKISNETFYNIALDSMYCIKNQNFSIFGYWDEPEIQQLEIRLYYCRNLTGTENCAPKQEVEDYLRSEPFYFNIFLVNTAINPQNYSTPATDYVVTRYKGVRAGSFKALEIFVKDQELQSDDGFIFSDPREQNKSISFDYLEPDDTDLSADDCLMNFMLLTSNLKEIHHREYKRISEVLADIGGLSSVFMFSIQILCYVFTSIKKDEIILNKIFDFDFSEDEKEPKLKSIQKLEMGTIENKTEPKEDGGVIIHRKDSDKGTPIEILSIENSPNISNHSELKNEFHFEKQKHLESVRRKSMNFLNLMDIKKSRNPSLYSMNNFVYPSEPLTTDREGLRSKRDTIDENIYQNNSLRRSPPLSRKPTLKMTTDDPGYTDVIKKVLALKDSNYQLKFSFCEVVEIFLCRCFMNKTARHKYALYNKSESVLDEVLDISHIVQKLEEFEKMKIIMLNKEQIALFNFIAKDICSMNLSKVKSSKINEMKELAKDKEQLAKIIIDFIQSLNKELDQSGINEIDMKLFDLLHDEFKENLVKV